MAFFPLQTEETHLCERAQCKHNEFDITSFHAYFISIEMKSQQIKEKSCQGSQLRYLYGYKNCVSA